MDRRAAGLYAAFSRAAVTVAGGLPCRAPWLLALMLPLAAARW